VCELKGEGKGREGRGKKEEKKGKKRNRKEGMGLVTE
jgi:hypothetical protein